MSAKYQPQPSFSRLVINTHIPLSIKSSSSLHGLTTAKHLLSADRLDVRARISSPFPRGLLAVCSRSVPLPCAGLADSTEDQRQMRLRTPPC